MNFAEQVAADEFDPWYQEHITRYHNLENFELGECVLDMACGNNVGSSLFPKNVARVSAIHQDPNTIEKNRKYYSKTSNLIFKCPLNPDFPNWIFGEDNILEIHDLFLVCKNGS